LTCTRTTARARSAFSACSTTAFNFFAVVSCCSRYLSGAAAVTRLHINPSAAANCDEYHIQTSGSYDGIVRQRSYALEIMYGAGKPVSVEQNGRVLLQTGDDGVEGTWFAAADHVAVYLVACDAFEAQSVRVCA